MLFKGIGLWGVNIPVGWGLDILNFVWWIGIGHAGTLISAILLLLRQKWRTSINRFAEAMTLFAVAQAGVFPLMHLGRPWLGYWLFPYPNTMGIWPQFRSPLMWDVFAVSTYATVSALFWFVGLIPDFATLRDRANSKSFRLIYGMLAMGWRGSARHWHRYETAYLLLAGLATPLVLSVHTIVSFDFAVGIIPGWHATIFPPYFVAGAIYAGFAMVLLLTIPLRKVFGLESFITMRHMHNMAKVMLATGLIVVYGYMVEAFFGWYSGNQYERFMIWNRMHGPYAPYYWALIMCNGLTPQLLWIKKIRSNLLVLWLISFVVSIGMWLERFVIVVTSLHRDFLPSSWGFYKPTQWDWAMFIGTIGFFFALLFLFIRFLPMISIFEMRTILPEAEVDEGASE
jgi:molybdopterin-containing oxidoreductase family membrane subunit